MLDELESGMPNEVGGHFRIFLGADVSLYIYSWLAEPSDGT